MNIPPQGSTVRSKGFLLVCLCLLVVTAACAPSSGDGGGGTPGVTVDTTTLVSFLESGSAGATVVLDAAPAGTVGVTVTSADETVATVSADDCATGAAGHTFTADADTWATPQTVSLCGVDNATYGGGVALEVTLAISVADTTDPDYADLEIPGATVNVIDDEIFYVKPAADGGDDGADGTSWATAFATIEYANQQANDLPSENPVVQGVWVRAGTYKGADENEPVIDFQGGVKIFGGFNGDEEILADRPHPLALSILDGDFNGDDSTVGTNDNGWGVVWVNSVSGVRLDGFVLANGIGVQDEGTFGGGILVFNAADFALANLAIVNNTAGYGGGFYFETSTGITIENVAVFENGDYRGAGGIFYGTPAVLTNVTFSGNQGSSQGAGIYASGSDLVLTNAGFSGNAAGQSGGGLYLLDGVPLLTNVSFRGNSASGDGGGIFSDAPTVVRHASWYQNVATNGGALATAYESNSVDVANSVAFGNGEDFYGNATSIDSAFTCNEDDASGTGNVPLVISPFDTVPTGGELYLLQNSPCVNAGDNTTADAALPGWAAMTTAADGTLDTGTVDMGRHYDPNHPVVLTLTDNAGYLAWSTERAESCHLFEIDENAALAVNEDVPLQESGANHPTTAGNTYYLLCYGAGDGNGIGQHTVGAYTIPGP